MGQERMLQMHSNAERTWIDLLQSNATPCLTRSAPSDVLAESKGTAASDESRGVSIVVQLFGVQVLNLPTRLLIAIILHHEFSFSASVLARRAHHDT